MDAKYISQIVGVCEFYAKNTTLLLTVFKNKIQFSSVHCISLTLLTIDIITKKFHRSI